LPRVTLARMKPALFPLPPTREQYRIVAKVDELMAICAELEAAQEEVRDCRNAARASSLRRLCAVDGLGDRSTYGRLWLSVSSRLMTSPKHVSDLRQAILDLAVTGRLVEQDLGEESADDLLARIRPGRSQERSSSDRSDSNLPPGWTHATVDDVFRVAGGIQKQPKRAPIQNVYPYVGVSNVQRGRLDLTSLGHFELFAGELEKLRLETGDILIVEGNGSIGEVGRCARWNGEVKDCVHQNHIIRCRPLRPGIERFAMLYLNSSKGIENMRMLAVTTAGLYNLSVGKIRRIALPLPPLLEQGRIVAKVQELMGICDALEDALLLGERSRARALEALIGDFLRQLDGPSA
jgi:type I restriction enzyme, S subunit